MTNWNGLKSKDGTVSEKEFNRLVDAVQAHSLRKGHNYTLNQNAGGVTILPKGKSALAAKCPFTTFIAANAIDPDTTIDVTFSPGTLNSLLPDNIFDTISIANTGLFYVILSATTDGHTVTSCSISIGTDPVGAQDPTPFALPTTFQVLLGIINDAVAYRVIGCGAITLMGRLQYTVEKDPPADPGLPTVTEYFNWVMLTDDL